MSNRNPPASTTRALESQMCTAMLSYWEIDGYREFELRSSYLHDGAFPAEPSPQPLFFIFAAATQLGLSHLSGSSQAVPLPTACQVAAGAMPGGIA